MCCEVLAWRRRWALDLKTSLHWAHSFLLSSWYERLTRPCPSSCGRWGWGSYSRRSMNEPVHPPGWLHWKYRYPNALKRLRVRPDGGFCRASRQPLQAVFALKLIVSLNLWSFVDRSQNTYEASPSTSVSIGRGEMLHTSSLSLLAATEGWPWFSVVWGIFSGVAGNRCGEVLTTWWGSVLRSRSNSVSS